MPNRDHKGPEGQGPMTGRKMGDCNNNNTQEVVYGRGLGRGAGVGAGRGLGRGSRRSTGRGLGRGRNN